MGEHPAEFDDDPRLSSTAGARDRDDSMFARQLDEPQIRSSPPRPVMMLGQVGNKADLPLVGPTPP
jgi:hypothetical protein